MAGRPDAPAADVFAQTQQQIRALADEVVRLSLADLAPADYFAQFLQRLVPALAVPAGAVWLRSAGNEIQQASILNPRALDLTGNPRHDELLRHALQQGRPLYVPPAEPDAAEGTDNSPAFAVLMAPITVGGQVEGLVEVWCGTERDAQAVPGVMQFLVRMADLAGIFLHRQRHEASEQGRLSAQLDAFSQRVHASLQPTEVAYLVANEGRQLAGCDRMAVALRWEGRRSSVEAVSGVDEVDQRSNLVRQLRALGDRVLDWGEKLVYQGVSDDTLPPPVLRALDTYLEESHSKILVILPLRDPRYAKSHRPCRAALVAECFTAQVPPGQLVGRLEVIGQHAGSALYNAAAYRHVPLRLLWQPVARVQAGLGGKTKALLIGAAAALVLLVTALIFVPYPLKMDAKGQLLPKERRWVYSPVEGQVVRFEEGVTPGARVAENQSLVLLYDVQLETKLVQLTHEIAAAQQDVDALAKQLGAATTEADRLRLSAERKQKEAVRDRKFSELRTLKARVHAEDARPGHFWIRAPLTGTVLNWDFRETMTNRQVKPAEPLLRIGDKEKRWEVELRIPQKHMGQITPAFDPRNHAAQLDVDLLLISAPTRVYKGKLARASLAGEASPNKDDATDSEAVVLASVRIDGPDIAAEDRIPAELLIAGTEVHAKVRCGDRALGYSLFYGVWEFFYEKVVFFF